MDYQAFTNDSLTMMYAAVRGALAADDAAESAPMTWGAAVISMRSALQEAELGRFRPRSLC
jgi:hypothetical protein